MTHWHEDGLDTDTPVSRWGQKEYDPGETKAYHANSVTLDGPVPSPSYFHADYNCPRLARCTQLKCTPMIDEREYSAREPCPYCTQP